MVGWIKLLSWTRIVDRFVINYADAIGNVDVVDACAVFLIRMKKFTNTLSKVMDFTSGAKI